MRTRRFSSRFLLGLAALVLGLGATWALTPTEPREERAPMRELLVEAGTVVEKSSRSELAATYNDRVQTWTDFLVGANRERTRLWLDRSSSWG